MTLDWKPAYIDGKIVPYLLRAGYYEINTCGGDAVLFFNGKLIKNPGTEDCEPSPFWGTLEEALDGAQAHSKGLLR